MLASRRGLFHTRSRLLGNARMASTKRSGPIKFGPFEVSDQVFLTTPHSYAVVNLKPLLPGHILVCPLTPTSRLTDLPPPAMSDLFTTVQLAQRMLAKAYFPNGQPGMGSFTVAVQDGKDAGQTVPHVHVHVIPRTKDDLPRSDEIYVGLSGEEGNVGGAMWDLVKRPVGGGGMPRVEDEDRKERSEGEMNEEAERYRALLKEMGIE